jgi:hypothetical protein
MKVFKNPEPKGSLILKFFENQNHGSLIMIEKKQPRTKRLFITKLELHKAV